MAVGTYDANGIWHYGESDNIAPFSTTLNKLADSASSAITADRARLATLEAGSLSGLIPVIPTSVTISGGTTTMTAVGAVSVATSAYVSLNGVFTSAYNKYLVILSGFACSTVSSNCQLRFRAAGADNLSASYAYAGIQNIYGSASSGIGSGGATSFLLGNFGTAQATSTVIEIQNPNLPLLTGIHSQHQGFNGNYQSVQNGGCFNATNQFDGFTIFPAAGNITGTVQVFGYND